MHQYEKGGFKWEERALVNILNRSYLKQQGAMFLKPNPLAISQSQQSVVVHHRVHVLYPQGVHIAVKHDVLAFVFIGGFVYLTKDVGQ